MIWVFLVCNMKKFIFIIGPQGSGKSTQAEILAKKLNYLHISSGKVLREMKEKKDPLGVSLANNFWLKGNLVPDDKIDAILFKKFEESDVPGFVVDGYPRNLNQLQLFLKHENDNEWYILFAYYLMVSEDICLERIESRIAIEKREDETSEAIKKRLEIYYKDTLPIINEFDKMGILRKINGEQSIEEISFEIQGL